MRNFAIPIQDVDRHENHAELHARQIDIDHLDAVHQIDAQPVAGRSPLLSNSCARRLLRESTSPNVKVRSPNSSATVSRRPERKVEQIAKIHREFFREPYHAMRYCGFECL